MARLEQFEVCAACESARSDWVAFDNETRKAVGLCSPCVDKAAADEETDWRYTDLERHE